MGIIKKFRIKSFKQIRSIIEFENVSLAYGDRMILENISFKINQGQIFGMLGPNGVGKSTIFNLITGLINPGSGKIMIAGNDATKYPIYLRTKKFKVGYVPQYGGWCAYALGAKAKKVSIDPETYEIRDGKLYLFYNAFFNNTLESWLEEGPKELQKKADKNWEKLKTQR